MTLTKQQFSDFIHRFQFRELFNEMGWNNDRTVQPVTVQEQTFTLQAVAEKSGFKILVCSPATQGSVPDYSTRRAIEVNVTKLFQEHLIIFCNAAKTEQIWQLVLRRTGQPTKITETRWNTSQDPELLYQRASGLLFELDEEEKITIVDVTQRVAANFHQNNEIVTRQFYERFKREHTAFLGFIKGIEENTSKDWYASLMLNRLMFCYFIQKKGFLDGNKNYLREKLQACREQHSGDKFYSFYRNFLLVLFHQGLNEPQQTSEVKLEIGNIPYLNGGLFDVHELEKTYTKIHIADDAFERLFTFFDQYEWHLDTRITATGRDINPDVIGYIFEKYINDRAQMGAYYTKEDITEYIGKNCILPFLFDETKRKHPKAFAAEAEMWSMLRTSGDAYIYDAVKHGINPHNLWGDLPEEVQRGFNEELAQKTVVANTEAGNHLWQLRKEWNKPAPASAALPTEIWREVIERRKRYNDITSRITQGEITSINDFITYNLNIRQFAQDVLETSTDAEFLKHFYKALSTVTILDPTCGSGAFLFAAMNILEPLYEACLQRMENFVAEAGKGTFKYFEEVLAQVKSPEHPNLQYFIYKSIILRNLHGVDIMKEAVEIAKLRLFLKLVATVDANPRKPNLGLEPLPDIDFNVRAGNALVGFATEAELLRAFEGKMDFDNDAEKIKERCDVVARAFGRYKEIQLGKGEDFAAFKKAKDDLRQRLHTLNEDLNRLLHKQASGIKYDQWLASHQPFHWFAEFYEIIHDNGGFDVIIGNPPYVEYSEVRGTYVVQGYATESSGNLYAFILERTISIQKSTAYSGMIVPLSGHSTARMSSLVDNYYNKFSGFYLFNISADANPSKLFEGVKFRLAIFITSNQITFGHSTKYKRWYSEEREYLFDNILYSKIGTLTYNSILPKICNELHLSVLTRIVSENARFFLDIGRNITYYHNAPVNWIRSHNFAPYFRSERDGEGVSTQLKVLKFNSEQQAESATCIICSSLFFVWWIALSDCYHLNKPELINFKYNFSDNKNASKLSQICQDLKQDLISKSIRRVYHYRTSGRVEYDEFYMKKSKSIIDQIDTVLAEHYGFTEEELDFIVNYDIKYRMGGEADEEE